MCDEKIAVLLSSYNGEQYIEQQVQSILNQETDCQITLFVRDDGSSDSTLEILNDIKADDNRLVVFPESNCGCNCSFFELVRKAYELLPDHQYFAFSDQDDVWDADKLQVGIDAIRKCKTEGSILYGSASRAVTADMQPIPRKRVTPKPITFYNSIIENFIAGHTQIMNRHLLEIIKDVDARQLYGHDSFIVNVAVLTGDVIYDNNPHVSYRQHGQNLLGTANSKRIDWIKERIRRVKKGDVKEYAKQIEYISGYCNGFMTEDQRKELDRFLSSRSNLASRIHYVLSKQVYRQEAFADFAFCGLYITGSYNT